MKIGPYSPEYSYDTPTNNSFFDQYNTFVEKSLGKDFQSTIILTFDTELFGKWTPAQEKIYPRYPRQQKKTHRRKEYFDRR